MATDPNTGFHQGMVPPAMSMYNPVVSFQTGGAVGGSSPVFSVVESPVGMSSTGGVVFAGSPAGIGGIPGMIRSSSTGNMLVETASGFKQDTPLAADWTYQEQSILEDGLVRYSNEPSIMRYIKIAALLPDKTVRDVALRCRWMNRKESGKRRKAEEYYIGKKVKDRKDRVMESSLNPSIQPCQPTLFVFPYAMPPMDCINPYACEVVDVGTSRLLEENIELLGQIEANLQMFKLQDNINLLNHTRSNITAILNSMREVPGIMQQMPPLPVALHEELADSILPGTSQQHTMYGMPSGNPMKHEPQC